MLRNGHEQGFLFSRIGEITMSSKERRGSYHAHDIAVERDTMTPPAASAQGGEVETPRSARRTRRQNCSGLPTNSASSGSSIASRSSRGLKPRLAEATR